MMTEGLCTQVAAIGLNQGFMGKTRPGVNCPEHHACASITLRPGLVGFDLRQVGGDTGDRCRLGLNPLFLDLAAQKHLWNREQCFDFSII